MREHPIYSFDFKLPKNVLYILDTLHGAGFEAYVVGGCVRDMILCQANNTHPIPNDYDIATSALPKQVNELFSHCIPTGIEHGTLSILLDSHQYEVTTFRIDGVYTNARVPDSVTFTSSIFEDLKRRDFTMNALAYSPHTGLIDNVGGVRDILKGHIVCVGDPFIRFSEDALRILRALRFASTLGFKIESRTKEALYSLYCSLCHVARERINKELTQLLCGIYAQEVLCEFASVFTFIVPRLPLQCEFSIFKSLEVRRAHIAWACFLYPCKMYADEILTSFKFDNKSKAHILALLKNYDMPLDLDLPHLKEIIISLGGRENAQKIMQDILVIKQAQNIPKKKIEHLTNMFQYVFSSNIPLSLEELHIGGRDIIAMGVKEGRAVGDILRVIFQEVLQEKLPNIHEVLLQYAKDMLK